MAHHEIGETFLLGTEYRMMDLESIGLGLLLLLCFIAGHIRVGLWRRQSEAQHAESAEAVRHGFSAKKAAKEEQDKAARYSDQKKGMGAGLAGAAPIERVAAASFCRRKASSVVEPLLALPEEAVAQMIAGCLPLKDWAALAMTNKRAQVETWEEAPALWRHRLQASELLLPSSSSSASGSDNRDDDDAFALRECFRRRWFGIEEIRQDFSSFVSAPDYPANAEHHHRFTEDLNRLSFLCRGLMLPRDGEDTVRAVVRAAVGLLRAYDCTDAEQCRAAAELVDLIKQLALGDEHVTEVKCAFVDSLELCDMLHDVQRKTDEAIQGYFDTALERAEEPAAGRPSAAVPAGHHNPVGQDDDDGHPRAAAIEEQAHSAEEEAAADSIMSNLRQLVAA